ncbi:hypothetical protein B296_00015837 [Ensete ventricosum]|uniref:SGNH hydrolase-type esterase domain-containing protein n=1 Tax=Ensete ventricosum TaxID=4639 RepID=A0A426ZRX1_ENSVE|nr:hypothetical protein B296_00015837 [Ensete ventricosum]
MAMKLAWVAVVLCTTIAAVCGGDEGLKASFVFGDSLVDAGNNNYLPSLSKADMRPNGIDFAASGGQPTGRLGMDVQLDYFNITRQQLDGLLGKAEAKEFVMKKSIFSVTVGSNDFLNNYLLPVVSAGERATETPDSFIESLIISFRSQLTVSSSSPSHACVYFMSHSRRSMSETLLPRRTKGGGRQRRADRMHSLPEDDQQSQGGGVRWLAKPARGAVQFAAEGHAYRTQ